jgi:phage repressor protein C with HTH and peptisase S24 domain
MNGCTGSEPFALRVLGDSMEPEFNEGDVLVIEPSVLVDDGCYVVAEHEGEYVFRQLTIEENKWYLKPLNSKYPDLQITGVEAIRGRIISKSNGRGRQRKRYL